MIVSFLFFACKTVPTKSGMQTKHAGTPEASSLGIIDNTFTASVVNNSRFSVTIDGKSIRPEETINNAFPLHDSELYDGWGVYYTVLLTKNVVLLRAHVVFVNNTYCFVITAPWRG